MTDWERVSSASESVSGKARRGRTYRLTPGTAYFYNEGDLHSPSRAGPTRLIRIEGVDMGRIDCFKYVLA